MDQRLSQADALPVPLGKLAHQQVADITGGRPFQDRVHAPRNLLLGDALDRSHEAQEVANLHLWVQRWRLGQVPDALLDFNRILANIEARDARRPVGRRQKAGQDAHRRSLPGSVRAEEAYDLAALDLEADVRDSGLGSVAFGDAFNLNHGRKLKRGAVTRSQTVEPLKAA